jgi:Transposase/Transposase IS116/IS110/IS902 family
VLFIGDDWAEDHHDIELEDEAGRRLTRARLPEGLEGITRLHALVAEHAPAAWAELAPEQAAAQVVVGIETDRGPWVTALRAAGYQVYAINPMSAARYRERHSTSGAKSDTGDSHVLAEIVRLDRDHHRPIAGDSDLADAIKLLARAHQTAVWERTRQVLRLRSTLLQYFPAAVQAFEDLSAPDALALLARAADPDRAAKLSRGQLVAALRTARRHHVEAKAEVLQAVLRAPALRQPATTQGAYAAVVSGQVGIISALNAQITQLGQVVGEHFGRHPATDIYLSQPGLGVVLAARTLGEFGDDTARFADARARKNYSGQSPITRASGKKSIVLARYATNRRLGAALHQQAFSALSRSPGARAYYDAIRARKIGHHAALRQLANRLVGILHGCLKTGTRYDEDTAWQHHRAETHVAAA